MTSIAQLKSFNTSRFSRVNKRRLIEHGLRRLSTSRALPLAASPKPHGDASTATKTSSLKDEDNSDPSASDGIPVDKAMSRRLDEMTDSSTLSKKDVEAAGFDPALKQQLLDRIARANVSNTSYTQASSIVNMPSAAGQGTRDQALATPWAGTESISDASLRMLDDAHKRLRVSTARPAGKIARPPKKVDTGRASAAASGKATGVRLAAARDRSSAYTVQRESTENRSEEEREQFRKQLKHRFTAEARPMPATIQGLAGLANERIEDAIARGQFKNLPSRGKKIERDHNASSPFLDTTEYFMNKIIQKQEIVPPWIEKQQEVAAAASRFRSGLRASWRRHAARVISSEGGTLQQQISRAERYARAEAALYAPLPTPVQDSEHAPPVHTRDLVDEQVLEHMSQISLAGKLQSAPEGANVTVTAMPDPTDETAAIVTTTTTTASDHNSTEAAPALGTTTTTTTTETITTTPSLEYQPSPPPDPLNPGSTPHGRPFRDPAWLATEQAYHAAAIASLNALTRSYNLLAPTLAKKPYFSLERELRSAFADVAPTVAGEIRERALAPRAMTPAAAGSALFKGDWGAGGSARVYDESSGKRYGFRQFWRDVFGAGGDKAGA